jgi:hypothetical protein
MGWNAGSDGYNSGAFGFARTEYRADNDTSGAWCGEALPLFTKSDARNPRALSQ